jgi:hypothetical protein
LKKELKSLKEIDMGEEKELPPPEEEEEKKKKSIIDSILKLVILAAIIPVLNAFGDMLGFYVTYGVWEWTPLLISVRNLSIPIMINWFKGVYDDTKADYELSIADTKDRHAKEIQELKDKHYAEMIAKNDEINGWKIDAKLAAYEPKEN